MYVETTVCLNTIMAIVMVVLAHQTGDEVVVVGGHHSDLLRLLQHRLDLLGGAIKHDVDLARLLHILQQRPVGTVEIRHVRHEEKKVAQVEYSRHLVLAKVLASLGFHTSCTCVLFFCKKSDKKRRA